MGIMFVRASVAVVRVGRQALNLSGRERIMDEELARIKERIDGLSNEELLRMIEVEYADYRPEALQFATAELDSRGVKYSSHSPSEAGDSEDEDEDEGDDDEEGDEADDDREPRVCAQCGARTRLGYLFTDREVTILFGDDEERFVRAFACKKCGSVQLYVDYSTEVEPGDPAG
jgi:Mg-chelatase subunit ChlI